MGKIVDLELSEDGTYGQKVYKATKSSKTVYKKQEVKRIQSGADEFLGGLDVGIDFVESIRSRALRIMNLRG
jgi:hypothetical protein